MKGANPSKLEATVKQYQGDAGETSYNVPGHVCFKKNSYILNMFLYFIII